MEKIDLNSIFSYFSPSFFSFSLFFFFSFSSLLLSLLSRLTLFTLQIGSFHTFFLALVYSKMTNPFLLFLGGFYSQRRGLKGAASRVFWRLVCKWGRCFGGWFAGNKERKKGKVMGKWGDGSLHGRRKGKVMGEGADCRR